MDYSTVVEGSHGPIAPEDCNFRVEVSTDFGADWATNGLRFKEQWQAAAWGNGLAGRWFAATNIRVRRESDNAIVEVII